MLGINNRDLDDFSVDIERTYELLSDVPAGKTVVSESGFSTREQLDELERVGVDAVLIGETLMRAPGRRGAVRELTGCRRRLLALATPPPRHAAGMRSQVTAGVDLRRARRRRDRGEPAAHRRGGRPRSRDP